MISLTFSTPYEKKITTLKFKGFPGNGHREDTKGNTWDIHDYIGGAYFEDGKAIIHARLVDRCPKYSTSPDDFDKGWSIKYIPYHVEFIK